MKKELFDLKAEIILNSRGRPTLKVKAYLEDGTFSSFSVPAGASKGKYEAKELRDGGEEFGGFGVKKAKENIEKIIKPSLKGVNVFEQEKIDKLLISLDGTKDKSKLGANSILGVSGACLKLAGKISEKPLWNYISETYRKSPKIPFLAMNFINGGKHSSSPLKFQEYLVILKGGRVYDRLDIAYRIFESLKKTITKKGVKVFGLGDEGGLVFDCSNELEVLSLFNEAVSSSQEKEGVKVRTGLDIAASSFFDQRNSLYLLKDKSLSKKEMLALVKELVKKYNIFYLEDPFEENDFESFALLNSFLKDLGADTLLIGDDLTVTNLERIKEAWAKKAINAVLIKPNQIGTISETIEAITFAQSNGLKVIVSHRSGETNDDFISDLAVGMGVDGIKAGSIQRGERLAKYNRLMEIESEMG